MVRKRFTNPLVIYSQLRPRVDRYSILEDGSAGGEGEHAGQ